MNILFLILIAGYPLEQELGGKISNGGVTVEIKCKVSKKGEKYVYTYVAKNVSNKNGVFGWDVIDRASYYGKGTPLTWEIKPKEEIKITLVSKEKPVWFTGPARLLVKGDARKKSWKEFFKEADVTLPEREFQHTTLFGQPGPLPLSYTKEIK